MKLRKLTAGRISGTGTIFVESYTIGGVLISTDNTNAAAVTLRRNNATGAQIIDISTITSMWITGPFDLEGTNDLYYSISGTGATAQLYEWVT